jgi:hypothetical protein
MVMRTCSISATARYLRISRSEAGHIKARAMKRGLERKKPVPARAVYVDEKGIGRGHDYVTVVTKVPEDGAPFVDFIADGRNEAALDTYWGLPTTTGPLGNIRCASMDMWQAYVNSATDHLPGGINAVTHDPFHIVQHMNKAVDEVRRGEQRLLPEEDRKELKGSRFMWPYGFENLPDKWEERMRAMKDGKTRTARAWRLKEQFREFYRCGNWAQGKAFFDDWHRDVMRSGLAPVKKVVKMIRERLPQVLNFFVHRITNAFSEGLNGIIQEVVSVVRGYRNRERLKRDLYFRLGNLDMLPASH